VIVRCGRCQNGFDVPGPGRHLCPTCGTPNEVRASAPDATGGLPPVSPPPSSPPEPDPPSPKVTCGECGFSFIVGQVSEAPCPNCGAAVPIGETTEAP
jgi:rRNA maturation endonuclease Nob1